MVLNQPFKFAISWFLVPFKIFNGVAPGGRGKKGATPFLSPYIHFCMNFGVPKSSDLEIFDTLYTNKKTDLYQTISYPSETKICLNGIHHDVLCSTCTTSIRPVRSVARFSIWKRKYVVPFSDKTVASYACKRRR